MENNQDLRAAGGLVASLESMQRGSRAATRGHDRQRTDYLVTGTDGGLAPAQNLGATGNNFATTAYNVNVNGVRLTSQASKMDSSTHGAARRKDEAHSAYSLTQSQKQSNTGGAASLGDGAR